MRASSAVISGASGNRMKIVRSNTCKKSTAKQNHFPSITKSLCDGQFASTLLFFIWKLYSKKPNLELIITYFWQFRLQFRVEAEILSPCGVLEICSCLLENRNFLVPATNFLNLWHYNLVGGQLVGWPMVGWSVNTHTLII